jgi:hypothetical protein
MSKQIAIQNAKAIVAGISKALNKFESHKKGIVYAAIEIGEKLIEAKNLVPHGHWESWLNRNSELRFGTTNQASKFIKIARNKVLVLEFLTDETSINNLTQAISDASPEQLEKVEQLKAEAEQKRIEAEQAKAEKSESAKKDIEAIDAEFTEVNPVTSAHDPKPEPAPKQEPVAQAEEQHHEDDPKVLLMEIIDNQEVLIKELQSENMSLVKVFESNEQLTQALEEIKKVKAISKGYEDRMIGLQIERAQLMQAAKYWQKRAEKAEKAVKASG